MAAKEAIFTLCLPKKTSLVVGQRCSRPKEHTALIIVVLVGFDFVPDTWWVSNCWGEDSAKQ